METAQMLYPEVRNYIAGNFSSSEAQTLEVISPLDGSLLSTMPLSGAPELDGAVKAAQKAFPAWAAMPIKERVQIFYRYKTLLEQNLEELTELVHRETAKPWEKPGRKSKKASS